MPEPRQPELACNELEKTSPSHAPIALFVYNRLWHTQQTVAALRESHLSSQSDLFVFADGARNERGQEAVAAVRDFVHTIDGFRNVTVIERDQNLGLAKSIISGVSQLVNQFGRVIVMEDDLLVSPYFLDYMNQALDRYADDERVISIHGYTLPVTATLPETFFIRGADCWGWATWKRGWALFETDGAALYEELMRQGLTHAFDLDGAYDYTQMLRNQIAGKNDSWAIRWHASAFLKNRLTLYPGHSLVRNIGMDNSGTHCKQNDDFSVSLSDRPVVLDGILVEENAAARESFRQFFLSIKPSLARRIISRAMRMLHR